MRDDRDYKVELSSATRSSPSPEVAPPPRPFVSVHFACCNVYLRIYRNANGTAYHGRCPRCGQAVRFAVGQGGTNARAFRVE
jgi:hypothetical protein